VPEINGDSNIVINNVVSIPQQSRGAGTVLMLALFGWWLLPYWWTLLLSAWIVWLPVAAIANIWNHGFFARNWYQPWPIWLFGIR
jgi:hypothetical protein